MFEKLREIIGRVIDSWRDPSNRPAGYEEIEEMSLDELLRKFATGEYDGVEDY